MPKLPLRPNVCMLLFNSKYKLFLGERNEVAGHWQFPQGGVEKKYSLRENVIRELKEELGIKKRHIKIIKKLKSTNKYNFTTIPDYAKAKWRGQDQTFWLVQFTGKDSDIELTKHEQEFMDWRWCTISQVKKLANPKRIKGYKKALKEFQDYSECHKSVAKSRVTPQHKP